MAIRKIVLLAVLVMSFPLYGMAQTSKEVNEANNPLTPKLTVNLQDQYISSYYGLDMGVGKIWKTVDRATLNLFVNP